MRTVVVPALVYSASNVKSDMIASLIELLRAPRRDPPPEPPRTLPPAAPPLSPEPMRLLTPDDRFLPCTSERCHWLRLAALFYPAVAQPLPATAEPRLRCRVCQAFERPGFLVGDVRPTSGGRVLLEAPALSDGYIYASPPSEE